MWAILFFGGCLVVGLAIARWWLLPLPVIAYLILDAASPVARDDDVTGFGRAVFLYGSLIFLGVGIVAGKLIRQIKEPHDRGERGDEI